jgi:hypothetical protein
MKKDLKNLFTEDVQAILTDETLTAIEEAVTTKVDLAVEAALLEQDNIYAEKLEVLIKTLDKDRAGKMMQVVESVQKTDAKKLARVVSLFKRESNKDFVGFKKQLVESVSLYLDEYLKESVSAEDFAQAVKNNSAFNVLKNIQKVLAVDSVMMKESVQGAFLDGKAENERVLAENAELKKQFKALYEQNQKTEKSLVLESKLAKFTENKKNFIKKALEDKSLDFINENFDYTVRLFDKQEKATHQVLKEDAISKRTVKPDFVQTKQPAKVVEERNEMSGYLEVLSKGKGQR